MRRFLESLFRATKGSISSKRVAGIFGWVVIHSVWVIVAVKSGKMPEYTDVMIIADAGLLGLDSVTDIWKNNKKEE